MASTPDCYLRIIIYDEGLFYLEDLPKRTSDEVSTNNVTANNDQDRDVSGDNNEYINVAYVDSLNVSVATAITIHHLVNKDSSWCLMFFIIILSVIL